MGQAIVDAQNDIGQGIVDSQNALGQGIVDAQNALGQDIVGETTYKRQAVIKFAYLISNQQLTLFSSQILRTTSPSNTMLLVSGYMRICA